MDCLDVLSEAFPFQEIDDDLEEEEEEEDEVEVEEEDEEEEEEEEEEEADPTRGLLQDDPIKDSTEKEWHQDSGFGTGSLAHSEQDPNEGSLERNVG